MSSKHFKYPKLFLLILTFILAYFIFKGRDLAFIESFLLSTGYIGTFFAGFFFSYGFTAPPATAILLIFGSHQNVIFASIIAAIGAMVGDLAIYHFIKFTFEDEIKSFEREKLTKSIEKRTPKKVIHIFIPILAGFFLVSPLPDEIAVTMFASAKWVPKKIFAVISFFLHLIGILIILTIGSVI